MRNLILLGVLISVTISNSYAQRGEWRKQSATWNYDLTKKTSKQDSVGGDNLSFISTVGKETFLPAPPSGSAMVSSTNGKPSFVHKSGSNASVKIRAANQNGSPAKFSVFGIKESTPVAAISFTITPDHQAKKTDWYFVFGKRGKLFQEPNATVPISKPGHSFSSYIFASFRLQSNEGFGDKAIDKYRFQNSLQPVPEDAIVWKNANMNLFTKGQKYEIELYINNTLAEHIYTLNGAEYKLPKRSYHLWVNGKKIGGDFEANAIGRNQPIDAFMLMSRDAVEGSVGSSNASTLEISDVKIKYGSR